MTNPLNVVVITEKLIGYLHQTRDEYIRSDLVSKVTQLAERFAPDNMWFIQTMNAVFELGEFTYCLRSCSFTVFHSYYLFTKYAIASRYRLPSVSIVSSQCTKYPLDIGQFLTISQI